MLQGKKHKFKNRSWYFWCNKQKKAMEIMEAAVSHKDVQINDKVWHQNVAWRKMEVNSVKT